MANTGYKELNLPADEFAALSKLMSAFTEGEQSGAAG